MNVINVTKIYYLVLGLLTLMGGIIAYVRVKSWSSLISGFISGVTLAVAGLLIFQGKTDIGLILGILVSVALAGQFVPKVMMNRAPPHVIIMAVLSAVSLVLTLICFAKK